MCVSHVYMYACISTMYEKALLALFLSLELCSSDMPSDCHMFGVCSMLLYVLSVVVLHASPGEGEARALEAHREGAEAHKLEHGQRRPHGQ